MKRRIILIFILSIVLFSSCINTHPEPLLGAYRFDDTSASLSSEYLLRLYDNGQFALIKAGGSGSDAAYFFAGDYKVRLDQFNFLKASGSLELTITVNNAPESIQNLPLSLTSPNVYTFYWESDKDKGPKLLQLKSSNTGVCRDLGDGYPIQIKIFEEELAKLKGEE